MIFSGWLFFQNWKNEFDFTTVRLVFIRFRNELRVPKNILRPVKGQGNSSKVEFICSDLEETSAWKNHFDFVWPIGEWQKWILLDHLPTSSCKCSLWMTPNSSRGIPPLVLTSAVSYFVNNGQTLVNVVKERPLKLFKAMRL